MNIAEVKKLSPDEINRVIAEALYPRFCDGEPPDYFHDLNSCHEAVSSCSKEEKETIHSILYSMTKPDLTPGLIDAAFSPANIRAIALAVVLSERKK